MAEREAERELIRRAKQGDQEAFAALVEENQTRVYNQAFRILDSREDADDIAQEVFIKAWTSLDTFREESSFSTWLYRMTANLCTDWIRHRSRRRNAMPVCSLDDEDAHIPEPPDLTQDPQLRLEQAETGRAIQRTLAQLPDHYREALMLRELQGMQYQEIADAMGIEVGTVKSRLARGRQQMIKLLKASGNIPSGYTSNLEQEKNGNRGHSNRKGGDSDA